ncbi:hypothetical protein [Flavitalea sp.]|nr:hypothetical protein [Flavitalea sp.]
MEEPIIPPNEKTPSQATQIIGYVLLAPPLLSVLLFFVNLFDSTGRIVKLSNLGAHWTGDYASDGGGYTSAAPIYLGLMAIAGASLLKSR